MSNGTYQAYSPFDILIEEAQIAPYNKKLFFPEQHRILNLSLRSVDNLTILINTVELNEIDIDIAHLELALGHKNTSIARTLIEVDSHDIHHRIERILETLTRHFGHKLRQCAPGRCIPPSRH